MNSTMARLPDQLSRRIRFVVSLRHTLSATEFSQPGNRIGGMPAISLGSLGSAGAVGTTYSSGGWDVGVDVGLGSAVGTMVLAAGETDVGEPVAVVSPDGWQAAPTIGSRVKKTITRKEACCGCLRFCMRYLPLYPTSVRTGTHRGRKAHPTKSVLQCSFAVHCFAPLLCASVVCRSGRERSNPGANSPSNENIQSLRRINS